MPQSSAGPGQGGPGPTQGGPQGDIYSRAASNAGPGSGGPAPPGAGPTQKTPDYNYGNYGAYSQVRHFDADQAFLKFLLVLDQN